VLDLRGMREEEAQTLVNQRLRMLRMEQLVSEQAQLEPLLAVTGGNPKAIEIALGLVKHERRPLQHVVDDLHAARGELFDDLFTRAWALLDEAAHRVLMVMTFFPTSANGEALAATADVHGYVFERAIERLTDLALLDVQQEKLNEAPRYALHSLVHAFAKAKLVGQPEVEEEARERWVEWCMQLVTRVGYCWNELERLDILTPEQETIFLAIQRMFNTNHFEQVMLLIKEANYYYYIRGFWTEKLAMNILYMQASQTLGRIPEMIKALADTVHLLSRQGNQEAASHYATELRTLAQHHDLPPSLHFDILHAFAHFAQLEGDLEAAQQAWYEGMEIARHLDPILFNNSQHRVAVSLLHQEKYQEAYAMFESALWESRSANYLRATAYHLSRMAEICIHWHQADQAALQLAESLNLISACQDRPLLARIQYIYARLHALRGDFPAACASLAEAIDLFERMGMRRELAEARAELAKLSAQGAPA